MEPITLEAIHSAWEFQWKVIGVLLPSLDEQAQQKVFSFTETMSHSVDWQKIFSIQSQLKKLDEGFTKVVDSIEAMKKHTEKMINVTKEIDAMSEVMQQSSAKMVVMLNQFDKKERCFQECVKLYNVGHYIFNYLNSTSNNIKQIYARMDAYSKEIPDAAHVEIPEMSKYDRNAAIDSILDYFNKGKMTEEQMKARLSEIMAKRNVVRTINSFGKINL